MASRICQERKNSIRRLNVVDFYLKRISVLHWKELTNVCTLKTASSERIGWRDTNVSQWFHCSFTLTRLVTWVWQLKSCFIQAWLWLWYEHVAYDGTTSRSRTSQLRQKYLSYAGKPISVKSSRRIRSRLVRAVVSYRLDLYTLHVTAVSHFSRLLSPTSINRPGRASGLWAYTLSQGRYFLAVLPVFGQHFSFSWSPNGQEVRVYDPESFNIWLKNFLCILATNSNLSS